MGCVIFPLHSTICYLICVKTPYTNSSIAYKFDSRGIVFKIFKIETCFGLFDDSIVHLYDLQKGARTTGTRLPGYRSLLTSKNQTGSQSVH